MCDVKCEVTVCLPGCVRSLVTCYTVIHCVLSGPEYSVDVYGRQQKDLRYRDC